MPWFPDFVAAAELARREIRAEGQADPVAQYLVALDRGTAKTLETVWPGEVVIFDPRAGEVRGHRDLRRFVKENHTRWAERRARTETVASTSVRGRAVVELLVHLDGGDGGDEVLWPLAVVVESHDDRSVVFRTYCSQLPIDGTRHLRPPILDRGPAPPDVVIGRYLRALDAGDADAIVNLFAASGYVHEPFGSHAVHRGSSELRAFFAQSFSAGGGIGLQPCAVTDDGVRCALEYNDVRWGRHELAPQAGIAVFERGPDGLLVAERIYDDVEPPLDGS